MNKNELACRYSLTTGSKVSPFLIRENDADQLKLVINPDHAAVASDEVGDAQIMVARSARRPVCVCIYAAGQREHKLTVSRW